jgi:NAD(P)-dependent dehydrogenase (short-subunit alcohol dehydrogenase family)
MRDLQGKVAVVTGAASGIGRAMAEAFAGAQMKVVLADVEPGPLGTAQTEMRAAGHNVLAVGTDVADAASVEELARRTLEEFGAVHVVCNNAGVAGTGQVAWELPLAAWQWMIDVNILGVIHGIKYFVPHLVAQGEGHVVNTTSIAGLVGGVGSTPYTATKHAVVGLSEALMLELEETGSGVGVSLLVPGRVDTRIADALRNWPARLGPVPEARRPDRLGVMPIPETLQHMMDEPTPPSEVAALVVDAVRTERFWVVTHPDELGALVDERRARLAGDAGAHRDAGAHGDAGAVSSSPGDLGTAEL